MLNDEDDDPSSPSDNAYSSVTLSSCNIPPNIIDPIKPPPEPPPTLVVETVPEQEWRDDEAQPTLQPYITEDTSLSISPTLPNSPPQTLHNIDPKQYCAFYVTQMNPSTQSLLPILLHKPRVSTF